MKWLKWRYLVRSVREITSPNTIQPQENSKGGGTDDRPHNLRNPDDRENVAYLNWNDDGWYQNWNGLDNDWNDNDRLLRRQSLHIVTPAKVREFTFEGIVNFLSSRQALYLQRKVCAKVRRIYLHLFLLPPREPLQKISDCLICDLGAIESLICLLALYIAQSGRALKYLRIIHLFFCRACSVWGAADGLKNYATTNKFLWK